MEVKLMSLLVLSYLIMNIEGEPRVIGSREPVKGKVGEDVMLPCRLEPPTDARTLTVEWKYLKIHVHVYRSRADSPRDQDERFRGRTSLFHEEMFRGNISLRLSNVTDGDSGNYTCLVHSLKSQDNVTLIVEPKDVSQKEGTGQQTNNAADVSGIGSVIAIIIALVAFYVWKKT